jgi:hypothetical protein
MCVIDISRPRAFGGGVGGGYVKAIVINISRPRAFGGGVCGGMRQGVVEWYFGHFGGFHTLGRPLAACGMWKERASVEFGCEK